MNKLLTEQELCKLTTNRLFAYRDSLLKCHETEDEDSKKLSKNNPEWKRNYALLKKILATRENIE